MRAAEAAGQHEVAMEWEQRAALFRQQRQARRMGLLTSGPRVVKSAAVGTLGVAGGSLVLGGILAATISAGGTDDGVDPLADILTVLGTADRMRTQEVLHGLAVHNPHEYRGWTFADLREVLDPAGAVRKSDGRMVVDRERVRDAVADRDDDPAADTAE